MTGFERKCVKYQDVILYHFEFRKKRNAKYSLRAFARDLNIQVSQLSRVLAGKQDLSAATARTVCDAIYTKRIERRAFMDLFLAQTSDKLEMDPVRLRTIQSLLFHDQKTFLEALENPALEDWFCLPLLDLLTLEEHPSDPSGIADQLGVPLKDVSRAISNLQAAGLISKDSCGRLKKSNRRLAAGDRGPSPQIRNYHRKLLERTSWAIDNLPLEQRFLSAQTLAVSQEQLPEVRRIVGEFFEQLDAVCQASGNSADSLLQLNLQYFNLLPGRG